MSNEFDGTDNDQAWVALIANDPAKHLANPDLDALKASVLSDAIKVAPISKRPWLAPVAVAASVALFVGGGAGYTIAAQSVPDSSNTISAPTFEMGAAMGGLGGQDEKMATSAIWGGRPFLEAGSGISDSTGTQVGYTFDASDVDRKVQLQLIADVFAIDGKISGSEADGYLVGDPNYLNANAQLSGASWDLSQIITWSYNDSSASPQYCGGNLAMYDTKSSGDSSVAITGTDIATPEPMPTVVPEPMPVPSDCVQPSGVLPSDESALALAKEKFGTLNFESDSAVWTVVDSGGQWGYSSEMANAYKLVTAKVLIDGLATNQSWSMTVGPDNSILSATGFFAQFVATSEYNIVGAKTAIERTQDGLWAANLTAQEVYREGMIYPMEMGISSNPSAVVKNQAGQPVLDAGIDRITIAKVEQSLISWYLNDGSTILLPAYLLSESSANDSRQWLQLAIADEYVDFN